MHILDFSFDIFFNGQYGIPILAVYRKFFTKNQVRRPCLSPKKKSWNYKMFTSLSNLFEEVVGLSNNLLVRNYKFYVDCVK